jgi:hypothetical protein
LFNRVWSINNFIGTSRLALLNVNVLGGLEYVGTLGGNLGDEKKKRGSESLSNATDIGKVRKGMHTLLALWKYRGFVNYASDLVANQTLFISYSTRSKGLAAIGVAGAGQSFTEMNKEVREGKASYSTLQMLCSFF